MLGKRSRVTVGQGKPSESPEEQTRGSKHRSLQALGQERTIKGTLEHCDNGESNVQERAAGASTAAVVERATDGIAAAESAADGTAAVVERATDGIAAAESGGRGSTITAPTSTHTSTEHDNQGWFFRKDPMKQSAAELGHPVLAAKDHTKQDGSKSMRYKSFPSHEMLLSVIMEKSPPCIYEIIAVDGRCKLYVDCEWVDSGAQSWGIQDIVNVFERSLLEKFAAELGQDRHVLEVIVLKGSRPQRDGRTKHSYHLVFPFIVFQRNNGVMREFVRGVHMQFAERFNCSNELALKSASGSSEKNPIDVSVYDRDRNFRAPLCHKLTDGTRTRLLLESDWELQGMDKVLTLGYDRVVALRGLYLRAFVTQMEGDHIVIPECAGEAESSPASMKHPSASSRHEASSRTSARAPVQQQDAAENRWRLGVDVEVLRMRLQDAVVRWGGLGRVRFDKEGDGCKLYFRVEHGEPGREEKCLAHGPSSQVTHCNDNQLITVETVGRRSVVMVCPHDGKCKRAHIHLGHLEKLGTAGQAADSHGVPAGEISSGEDGCASAQGHVLAEGGSDRARAHSTVQNDLGVGGGTTDSVDAEGQTHGGNVGDAVSCNVGDAVSCNVGDAVSCNVGDAVSCNVGDAVSCNVGDAVSGNVDGNLNVGDTVGDVVGANVGGNIESDAVAGNVGYDVDHGRAGSHVRGRVGGGVGGNVGGGVGGNVGGNLCAGSDTTRKVSDGLVFRAFDSDNQLEELCLPDCDTIYESPTMSRFHVVPTLAVKAAMGTGKSKALRQHICRLVERTQGPVACLCITHRKTFSRDMLQSLYRETIMHWDLYSDISGREIDLRRHPKLICQVECLRKLVGYRKADWKGGRLVVVLDEWNTVMCTTVGPFANTEDKLVFETILREAGNVIALDAHLDAGTVNALSMYRYGKLQYLTSDLPRGSQELGPQTAQDLQNAGNDCCFPARPRRVHLHINTHKTHASKTFQFVKTEPDAVMHVINSLHAGRPVVVAVHSKQLGFAVEALIKGEFSGSKKGVCLTADSDDRLKKEHFDDPATHWAGFDYLIYTSMLEVGVSYETRDHFQLFVGIFNNTTSPLWHTSQMLFRVRDVRHYFLHVTNVGACTLDPCRETIRAEVVQRRQDSRTRTVAIPTFRTARPETMALNDVYCPESLLTKVRAEVEVGNPDCNSADLVAYTECEHHVRMSKLNFERGLRKLLESSGGNVLPTTAPQVCFLPRLRDAVESFLTAHCRGENPQLAVLSIHLGGLPGSADCVFACSHCVRCHGESCNIVVNFGEGHVGRVRAQCSVLDPAVLGLLDSVSSRVERDLMELQDQIKAAKNQEKRAKRMRLGTAPAELPAALGGEPGISRDFTQQEKTELEKHKIAWEYGMGPELVDEDFTLRGWDEERAREAFRNHRALRLKGTNPECARERLRHEDEWKEREVVLRSNTFCSRDAASAASHDERYVANGRQSDIHCAIFRALSFLTQRLDGVCVGGERVRSGLDIDDFGVPVREATVRANLSMGDGDHAVSDPAIIDRLRTLHKTFSRLGIAGRGADALEQMTFRGVLGMINTPMRKVYGITLRRSTNDKTLYTLWPCTIEYQCKTRVDQKLELDLAGIGLVGVDDRRARLANEWIRLMAGLDPSEWGDGALYERGGGPWRCTRPRKWPKEAARLLLCASLQLFHGMDAVVSAQDAPNSHDTKRVAGLVIGAVYGGRAAVNYADERVSIKARGRAPTLPRFLSV